MNQRNPFVEYGGALVLCSVLLTFLYFIHRLGLTSRSEVQRIKDKRMVDVSSVSLPFNISSAKVTRSSSSETLHIDLIGCMPRALQCYFHTPMQEFLKYFNLNNNDDKRQNITKEKSAKEALESISLHTISKEAGSFNNLNGNCCQVLIPLTDVPALALEVLRGDDGSGIFEPLIIALEVMNDVSAASGNDIKCLLNSFTAQKLEDGTSFLLAEQFIELFDGRVLRMKRLFDSGLAYEPIEDLHHSASTTMNASSLSLPDRCIVCADNPVTRAFLPCRHACVCKICFSRLPGSECPVCRTGISSFFLVHDESGLPRTEEEAREEDSRVINNMGLWEFIKSVWNAS